MNISEFFNSITLDLSDLESDDYVEGITKIILDKLNSMDIYKRPIHCSDAKRKILYVKNNDVWDKEEKNNPKLRCAIKSISINNIKQSTGGNGEISDSEDKIIRRIAKEIVIGKNKL
jgi:hypothetical protein